MGADVQDVLQCVPEQHAVDESLHGFQHRLSFCLEYPVDIGDAVVFDIVLPKDVA